MKKVQNSINVLSLTRALSGHTRSVHNSVNFNMSAVDGLKNDEDKYKCKVCSKSFSGFDARDMMIEHLAKRCKEDKKY